MYLYFLDHDSFVEYTGSYHCPDSSVSISFASPTVPHVAEAGIVMLDSSFVEPSSVSSQDLESDINIYSCSTQSENSSADWQYSW